MCAVGDDRDPQRRSAGLGLADRLPKPVNALPQPSVATAHLDQAHQVRWRSHDQPIGHQAPEIIPGPAGSLERHGQPPEPDLPWPGQRRAQDIAARRDDSRLDLQWPEPLRLPRKLGPRLAGDDDERRAALVRRLAAHPDGHLAALSLAGPEKRLPGQGEPDRAVAASGPRFSTASS